MRNKVAPLPASFMLASIIGFLVSSLYIYQKLSNTWGFTFSLLFGIMFISSVISFTHAPSEDDLKIHTGKAYRR